MAELQYTVFEGASQTADGPVVAENVVAIESSANASSAIPSTSGRDKQIMRVRLHADADCYVTWGESGIEADNTGAGGRKLGSENPEYFSIESGYVISVIERV